MIVVSNEIYEYAIPVGNDVILSGTLDGPRTVNRLYALYRKGKVVAYTMRQLTVTE